VGAHCDPSRGATASGYREVALDAGRTLAVTVKVSANRTTRRVYSSLVGPVGRGSAAVISTVQPLIVGQPVQGQTLIAGAGSWNKIPTTTTYLWQRCNANGRVCVAIAGATQEIYLPTVADLGHALTALVGVRVGRQAATAFGTSTDPITAAELENTSPPLVGGILRVGQQLTADTGTWTGAQPIAYRYQWYRCDPGGAHCSAIRGATADTYRLVADDVDQTIGLTVTASNSTATTAAYASLAGPIAPRASTFVSTIRPQLIGNIAVGQTVGATPGIWSTTPTALTYQWLRCNQNGRTCTPITSATSASYALTSADAGHALVVRVTATADSLTATTLSRATTPVL
jgi:hypothetical protein